MAKKLTKKGAIIEDKNYVYRLTHSKERWVERKAKIDFMGKGWTDGTEAYTKYANWEKSNEAVKAWTLWHPSQTKLLEVTEE